MGCVLQRVVKSSHFPELVTSPMGRLKDGLLRNFIKPLRPKGSMACKKEGLAKNLNIKSKNCCGLDAVEALCLAGNHDAGDRRAEGVLVNVGPRSGPLCAGYPREGYPTGLERHFSRQTDLVSR